MPKNIVISVGDSVTRNLPAGFTPQMHAGAVADFIVTQTQPGWRVALEIPVECPAHGLISHLSEYPEALARVARILVVNPHLRPPIPMHRMQTLSALYAAAGVDLAAVFR
jgi:hypothetical protein